MPRNEEDSDPALDNPALEEQGRAEGAAEVRRYLIKLIIAILAGVVLMATVAVVAWYRFAPPLEETTPPQPPPEKPALDPN